MVVSAIGGLAALWSVARRRYRIARVAAALAVAAVVAGWGVAQWPYMLPQSLKVSQAAAPSGTLSAVVVVFVILGYLGTEPTTVWGQFAFDAFFLDTAATVPRTE